MKFQVMSQRGHDEAVIEDVKIQEQIFNKLTGKNEDPLPAEFKTKIPDTFQDLEELWRPGNMARIAVTNDNKEYEIVKNFDPKIRSLLFIAPQRGG